MKRNGQETDGMKRSLNSLSRNMSSELGRINLGTEIILGIVIVSIVFSNGSSDLAMIVRSGTTISGQTLTLLLILIFVIFVVGFGVFCLLFIGNIHQKNILDLDQVNVKFLDSSESKQPE